MEATVRPMTDPPKKATPRASGLTVVACCQSGSYVGTGGGEHTDKTGKRRRQAAEDEGE